MASAEAKPGSVGTPAITAVMATDALRLRALRLRMIGASSRRRRERSSDCCQSSSEVRSREYEYTGVGLLLSSRLRGELTGSRWDMRYTTLWWRFAPRPNLPTELGPPFPTAGAVRTRR